MKFYSVLTTALAGVRRNVTRAALTHARHRIIGVAAVNRDDEESARAPPPPSRRTIRQHGANNLHLGAGGHGGPSGGWVTFGSGSDHDADAAGRRSDTCANAIPLAGRRSIARCARPQPRSFTATGTGCRCTSTAPTPGGPSFEAGDGNDLTGGAHRSAERDVYVRKRQQGRPDRPERCAGANIVPGANRRSAKSVPSAQKKTRVASKSWGVLRRAKART
jgi:hypothetical protein